MTKKIANCSDLLIKVTQSVYLHYMWMNNVCLCSQSPISALNVPYSL